MHLIFEEINGNLIRCIRSATPDTTKLSCLCRARFGSANCITDNSRLSSTEKLKSEHINSYRPIHTATPDTTVLSYVSGVAPCESSRPDRCVRCPICVTVSGTLGADVISSVVLESCTPVGSSLTLVRQIGYFPSPSPLPPSRPIFLPVLLLLPFFPLPSPRPSTPSLKSRSPKIQLGGLGAL